MKTQSIFVRGTHATIKRAWLFTWEWAGNHAEVENKFVAIFSSRYSYGTIKQMLVQYYVGSYLALHEQFSFVKSTRNCPFEVENITIEVSESLQKTASLPSRIPFSE